MAASRGDPARGRGCDASGKGATTLLLGNPEEVERVFRHFDANGDGKISASELADVVRALSGSGGDASEEEVRRMMEEMDTDRDGYVDLAEFVAFHGGGGGAPTAADSDRELKEAFRMYDLNGDGVITARELQQVLKRLGDSKCSVRDCSRMISSVDADGDGAVNFQEFKKMMTNPPPPTGPATAPKSTAATRNRDTNLVNTEGWGKNMEGGEFNRDYPCPLTLIE